MMLSFVRIFAALSLCTLLVACDSAEQRAEKHFQSALELIEAGDYARAEIEFRNVFELDGSHKEAREAYAQMLLDTGQAGRAASQYLRLVEQFPEDLPTRVALTQLAMDRQSWDEVRRHGEKVQELDPTNPVGQVAGIANRYRTAVEDEDDIAKAEAAAAARNWLEQTSDQLILRYILIQEALDQEDADSAIAEIDRVLEKRPDDQQLQMMRLRLLAALSRRDDIETSLTDLIDRFPENEQYLPMLLQLYNSGGQQAKSVEFLRDYVATNPDDIQAMNSLIEMVFFAEGADAALAEVDRLIDVGNNVTILATQRARLQYESGDRDNAIAAIEALLADVEVGDDAPQMTEEISTARVILARMLQGVGNEVGARRQVELVLEQDETNSAALKMQARWLILDDNPDQAVTLLRRAIDSEPEDWQAMLLMADAFTRAGSHDLARDFVSLAVENSNFALEPSLRFADTLISEDRLLLAEETLVNALRQAPDNLALLTRLGRLQVTRRDWPRVEQVEGTLRRIGTDEALRAATGLEVARLAETAQTEEALQSLEGLSQADDSVQALVALVRARFASGDPEGALSAAQTSFDNAPDDLARRIVLASTLVSYGRVDDGRMMMEEILAENDQIEAAWTTLIRIASAQRDTEARNEIISRARRAMPNSVAIGWADASAKTEAGDSEGAISIYESIYERASGSLLIANNLATLLANTRTDEESLDRAYAVARRLRGSDVPAFQDTYGWIAFRRGDVREAVTYLEDAAASLPNEPSVRYHLGAAYLADGQKRFALREFLAAAESQAPAQMFPEISLAREEADKLLAEGVEAAE